MRLEIIITPTGNPTPNRNWDWEAHVDGCEEDGSGLGATQFAALMSLMERLEDNLEDYLSTNEISYSPRS